jgi:hypothetical protein
MVYHVAGEHASQQVALAGDGLIGFEVSVVFAPVLGDVRVGAQAALYLALILLIVLPLDAEELRAEPRHARLPKMGGDTT